MHPSAVIVTVGAIGLAIAIAGGFGAVPYLSLAGCAQNCSGGLSPSFVWQSTGGSAISVTDTSTITGSGVSVLSVQFGWGDGTPNTYGGYHQTVPHAFVVVGTYTVSEAVDYVACTGLLCLPQISVAVASVSTGTSGTSGASVTVSFTDSVSAQTLTVTDRTTTTGSPSITGVVVSWGDQAASSSATLGMTISHTYANSATYNVTESVSWSFGGRAYLSTSSVDVGVGVITPSTPFSLNGFGFGLLLGSGALLATQAFAATRNPAISVAIAAGAGIVGFLFALVVVV
jgi:hypothetical protein